METKKEMNDDDDDDDDVLMSIVVRRCSNILSSPVGRPQLWRFDQKGWFFDEISVANWERKSKIVGPNSGPQARISSFARNAW